DNLVQLDLREVGVEGGVEGQVLRQVPLEIEPQRGAAVVAAAGGGLTGVAAAQLAEREGLQLQRARPLEIAQPLEAAEEGDGTGHVARDVGPDVGLLALGDE